MFSSLTQDRPLRETGKALPAFRRSEGRTKEAVIALARLADAAAKRFMTRLAALQRRAGDAKRLELVETLALGGRRQLFVVLCDNQHYLVGAGAETVGTIVAIEAKPKPLEKAAKGPLLVREKARDAGRIVSAEAVRRKSFEAASETGNLWP